MSHNLKSVPPGLDKYAIKDVVEAGGDDRHEWTVYDQERLYTNAFVFSEDGSKVRTPTGSDRSVWFMLALLGIQDPPWL
jgi:hypothetical protein